jgi:hypothetical protein
VRMSSSNFVRCGAAIESGLDGGKLLTHQEIESY